MTQPTQAELNSLRSRPHETNLWLSIYNPQTVLACQITGSMDRGSREIPYDTVSTGSYLLVENGMTMYVGTTLGGTDVGRTRVKSATATAITVAENSDIVWGNDYYLTVKNYFEIWPVFPRIILNTGTLTTTWYKDWDISYSNQNTNLGSFINMGCHHAAFVGDNIYYSASGTSSLKGESLSYNWWFQGAVTTGSSSQTPGNITYNTPGHYTTRLQVTTATGTVDTSYRHISIYDRPESGTSTSILKWNLVSLDGSREQGGYTARIVIRDDIPDIVDGSLVVIFGEDRYSGTASSIGGNASNRGSIVFSGYVIDGSITYNWQDKSVEFEVGSPTEIMKLAEGFGVSVQSSSNPQTATNDPNIPSGWVALLNMDCRRAIYHYLRWHSTVLMTNDFSFIGTDQNIQYFDADRESLYSAVQNLMSLTLVGDVVCDRQGKIFAEVSVAVTDDAENNIPYNMTIDKQDWIGNPVIDERQINQTSFLEMGGVYFPGPGYDSSALMASAPGSTPAYRGRVERIQGLALSSQNQLNTLVGNYYAWKNSRFPSVSFDIAGNYRNFDIAPQEIVRVILAQTDTPRGLTWNSKAFTNRSLGWSYDAENGLFRPRITLSEVTQGIDGDTIVIPPVPPTEAEGGGGFYIPPFVFPPFPPFPVPVLNLNIPNLLIPCTFALDIGSGLEATWDTAKYLYVFPEGDTVDGICNFYIPQGVLTTIVQPIFLVNSASGNVYLETFVRIGGCGEIMTSPGTTSVGAVALPSLGAGFAWACLGSVEVITAGNQLARVTVKRDATDPSDTSTDNIWFVGVAVSFSAL